MTHSFTITPKAPYSFDLTVARFMRFASENVDLVAGKQYQRLLAAGRQLALATVTNVGTVAKPQLQLSCAVRPRPPSSKRNFKPSSVISCVPTLISDRFIDWRAQITSWLHSPPPFEGFGSLPAQQFLKPW